MSTYDEFDQEFYPYAELPPQQSHDLVRLADHPERLHQMLRDVAEYVEKYGGGEEVRAQAGYAMRMPVELLEELLDYYRQIRIQQLLQDVKQYKRLMYNAQTELRTYLDLRGPAEEGGHE
ncbi:MAG: hypothetical protein SGJ19_27705 [Planctomycetia bacterium]|nr:hypothetical protein [Planctomycetia bacterium]